LFIYLNSQKPYTGNAEPITLGVYPSEYSSLIYIANDEKYFSANGLDVTLKNYPSGASAVQGTLKGEVDISTASEFVIVSNALLNAELLAFGSVSKYLNVYLVARTDKDIHSGSDLEGKTIGVSIGTALQFYLGRFLDVNGINQSQVTLVNLDFEQTPDALSNGTVDAAVSFQPYINQIQSLLPDLTVVLPIQSNQYGYFEATCTKAWATAHPDSIARFLKALIQAENFNINNQNQAISILSKELNYTKTYTTSVWSDYQYSVTLDQTFVLLMQEEARWLINNNLTSATSVPDFLNYIYVTGLESVSPESVNIIGLGD
jgi:NitT/TauT family transport system substrate-binding protein